MDPAGVGLTLLALAVAAGCWLGYRLLVRYGQVLLRVDALQEEFAQLRGGYAGPASADGARHGRQQERREGVTEADERALRLNLACGGDLRSGWVNHDRTMHEGIDVAWDLRDVPWPIGDDTCAEILAQDVLEHLPDVVPFMDECWRLLRRGGTLTIRAVLANSDNHWLDPTHVRGFLPESFHYFDPERFWGATYGRWYTSRYWKLEAASVEESNVVAVLRPRKGCEDVWEAIW